MANPPPRYSKPRVFVRAVESITYSLNDMRRQRLAKSAEACSGPRGE